MSYKLNLLILVQSLEKGGRTKRILQEKRGYEAQGYQVTLAVMAPPPQWVKDSYSDSDQWQILTKRPKFDLLLIGALMRLILKQRIHILHAHCEASVLYGALAAKLTGRPLVATYHRSKLEYYRGNFKNRLFARLPSAVVAISTDRRQLIQQHLQVPAARTWLIHGAFEPQGDCSQTDKYSARTQLGLTATQPVVFSAGHLGEIKGHDISIQALSMIDPPDRPHLYIAGDGSPQEYARLQQLIHSLQLDNQVTLLGQVSNPMHWMIACDIFLQPSLEEGFGLVFVEAGCCSRPCIATAVGGIKDIIIDHETGLLVPPGSATAVKDALAQLLHNPEFSQELGHNAQRRVQQQFTLQQMINRHITLYESLLSPQQRSSAPATHRSRTQGTSD